MAFTPGTPKPKNSGRKKGTPNKVTATFQELVEKAFEGDLASSLATDIRLVHSPLERAKLKLALIEFIYPKRKAVEMTADVEVNSTEIEVDQLAAELVRQIKES